MKKSIITMLALCSAAGVMADTFGTGANEFELTFQGISSGSNPSSGYGQVGYNYDIGTHEVTADQWSKYISTTSAANGTAPSTSGAQAVNNASWNEAAQFVNWLNTSSGHQAAYSFDGSGNMSLWGASDKSATSAFRHKNAVYVLPSEDEWVKAAYWNGSSLQTYSTTGDTLAGMDVNYNAPAGAVRNVGIGSEEINGTFDMMGNVWEWNESAYAAPDDSVSESRVYRGGSFFTTEEFLRSSERNFGDFPTGEGPNVGFRVAAIPEPASIALIGLFGGGILFIRRMFMM